MKNEIVTTENSPLFQALTQQMENQRAALERVAGFEKKLSKLLLEHDFSTYDHYIQAKSRLMAAVYGNPPLTHSGKYRRRTRADEDQVEQLVKKGWRTKDIARELHFPPNTVSNIKNHLRAEGRLEPRIRRVEKKR